MVCGYEKKEFMRCVGTKIVIRVTHDNDQQYDKLQQHTLTHLRDDDHVCDPGIRPLLVDVRHESAHGHYRQSEDPIQKMGGIAKKKRMVKKKKRHTVDTCKNRRE